MADTRQRRRRGETQMIVIAYLAKQGEASMSEISAEVQRRLGPVPKSTIRSHLNKNTPGLYERITRGRYQLADGHS